MRDASSLRIDASRRRIEVRGGGQERWGDGASRGLGIPQASAKRAQSKKGTYARTSFPSSLIPLLVPVSRIPPRALAPAPAPTPPPVCTPWPLTACALKAKGWTTGARRGLLEIGQAACGLRRRPRRVLVAISVGIRGGGRGMNVVRRRRARARAGSRRGSAAAKERACTVSGLALPSTVLLTSARLPPSLSLRLRFPDPYPSLGPASLPSSSSSPAFKPAPISTFPTVLAHVDARVPREDPNWIGSFGSIYVMARTSRVGGGIPTLALATPHDRLGDGDVRPHARFGRIRPRAGSPPARTAA
ncbi:hypothetical protein FB451DRAFT_1567113 [Mycena latifolia]|nr:hypothetical protein FB451DRAFT_1567113 [Mycena latifolia]